MFAKAICRHSQNIAIHLKHCCHPNSLNCKVHYRQSVAGGELCFTSQLFFVILTKRLWDVKVMKNGYLMNTALSAFLGYRKRASPQWLTIRLFEFPIGTCSASWSIISEYLMQIGKSSHHEDKHVPQSSTRASSYGLLLNCAVEYLIGAAIT